METNRTEKIRTFLMTRVRFAAEDVDTAFAFLEGAVDVVQLVLQLFGG